MKKGLFVMMAVVLMTTGDVWAQHKKETKGTEKGLEKAEKKVQEKGGGTTLTVEGKCGMCKSNIEKAAKGVDGVKSAKWNSKTKQLAVNFDDTKTSIEKISKAIAVVGYDTEKDKAEDATYAALPACCKYR